MTTFTERFLRSLKPRATAYRIAEPNERGAGRLIVKVDTDGGRSFYFRFRSGGSDQLVALGRHDERGVGGISLKQAHAKAEDQRRIVREHKVAPKVHREQERRRRDDLARRGSLGDLLVAYADALKAASKLETARDVRRMMERNVRDEYRTLWKLPAADVRADHVKDILTTMVKAKLTRQVNKVRSYLHAAFVWGAKADNDPRQVAVVGKRFEITTNPVSLVPRVAEWDRARDRVLDDDELAHYVRALAPRSDIVGLVLKFLLVTGGQRVAQVLRAPWSVYDFEARTLLLRDPKGRGPARDHLLPLSDDALAILAPLQGVNRSAPGPFSIDGEVTVHLTTMSVEAAAIAKKLHDEHKVPAFQLRDVRRTAETTLARLGVSKDVRSHLLSHGRANDVQGRHYDRYSYLPEKKAALAVWQAHLRALAEPPRTRRTATVVPLGSRRR